MSDQKPSAWEVVQSNGAVFKLVDKKPTKSDMKYYRDCVRPKHLPLTIVPLYRVAAPERDAE